MPLCVRSRPDLCYEFFAMCLSAWADCFPLASVFLCSRQQIFRCSAEMGHSFLRAVRTQTEGDLCPRFGECDSSCAICAHFSVSEPRPSPHSPSHRTEYSTHAIIGHVILLRMAFRRRTDRPIQGSCQHSARPCFTVTLSNERASSLLP
jgi:hypothetical protein